MNSISHTFDELKRYHVSLCVLIQPIEIELFFFVLNKYPIRWNVTAVDCSKFQKRNSYRNCMLRMCYLCDITIHLGYLHYIQTFR